MTEKEFKDAMKNWYKKVMTSYELHQKGMAIDTYHMMMDVDAIIAEGFDHDLVIVRTMNIE